MSVSEYKDEGPVFPAQLNLETLKGKSVIITGGKWCLDTFCFHFLLLCFTGANGLGKAYAEAFVKAK